MSWNIQEKCWINLIHILKNYGQGNFNSFLLCFSHLFCRFAVSNFCMLPHLTLQIDGNHQKEVVFQEIGSFLSQVQKDKAKLVKPGKCFQVLKFLYKFAQGLYLWYDQYNYLLCWLSQTTLEVKIFTEIVLIFLMDALFHLVWNVSGWKH